MAMSPRGKKMLLFAPFALVGLVLFIALGGELVRQLWNWLLPPLFGFREITFWQALGVLVLSRILFGGFGGRGSGGRASRMAFAAACERAFRRMDANWDHMTPEERERFCQRMRERFGMDMSSPGPKEP
jgi:hypothetical protein